MMPKILFYSDCEYFAGCENMLSLFSSSEKLRNKYRLSIAFRRSGAYRDGLRQKTSFLKIEKFPCTMYREVVGGSAYSIVARSVGKFFALVLRPLFFSANVVIAWKIVRRQKPNIVHINNGGFPGALSCNAMVVGARLAAVRNVVYVVNNLAVPYRSISRIFEFFLDQLVVSCVDLFITGSRKAKKRLEDVLSLSTKHVINLPNGIKLKESVCNRDQLRADHGLKDDDIAIGIVAVLEWRKGHRYLVESFSKVMQDPNSGKNAILLIEGDGPEREALEEQVREKELEGRVRFIGRQPNIFNFYRAIDILVFSSIANEDFPNVILEGMSLSLPIIASQIAGVPEQIDDGVSGLLVNPRDTEAMKMAIEKMINDENLRKCLGQAAYIKYCNSFSADIAVDRYIHIYNSMACNGIGGCN